MFKKKIFFVFGLTFLIVSTVFAIKPVATEWGIQYQIIPKYPAPGDYVFLKINSYSIDLDSSNISYSINDVVKKGGTGVKSFSFKIPNNNKPVKLNITATDFNNKVENKEIIIKPVSVDLVYEVIDPYRPPFYKGKSTALSHSKVKFFAFPNFKNSIGKTLDKKTLLYTWKINNKVVKNNYGIGKDTLTIDKVYGFPRETKVEVIVRNLNGDLVANKVIILKPGISDIDFYIDEKVMPFRFKSVAKNGNLTSYHMDTDIVAIPYFFNNLNISNIEWKINGNKINLLSGGDDLRINIIRNQDNIAIPVRASLKIENNNRPLQAAEGRTVLKVDQKIIDKYQLDKKIRRENEQINDNNFFGL